MRVATLQTSLVQTFASPQSAFELQQAATVLFTHVPGVPAEVSQLSVVQAFPSLHCALMVHASACSATDGR